MITSIDISYAGGGNQGGFDRQREGTGGPSPVMTFSGRVSPRQEVMEDVYLDHDNQSGFLDSETRNDWQQILDEPPQQPQQPKPQAKKAAKKPSMDFGKKNSVAALQK